MIGFWRKRSKTIIVHLVFWPIIAVFVIWGFERAGNPVGGAAAVVNDRTITLTDYRNALQRITDFYSQMMQGRFDDEAQKQYHVRETALNQLITNELISEQAEKMGLRVTDEEVRQKILESPMLVKEGRFSRENYDGLLRYYHMTPVQFESDLKRSALIEKTRKIFEANLGPSLAQIEKDKLLKATKTNLEYLKIDRDEMESKINVSDNDSSDFLKDEAHQKQVKEYYDLHKSTYTQEESISAHHILVKATKGKKAEEDGARIKIVKIKEELAKSPFEVVAKKFSDDPGSKMKGGDLGSFSRGRMVPEFEKTAFSLPIGMVSDPIQTDFGFHLIRVDSKKPATSTSFEQAKVSIAKKLLAQKKLDATIASLDKKMASNPEGAVNDLESLVPGVKWEETGFFSNADDQVPKIGGSEEVMAEALGVSASKPYFTKLIQSGNSIFALKYKATEEASSVEKPPQAGPADKDSAKNIFFAWTGTLAEKANIKRNPRLFTDDAPTSNE